MEVFPARAAPTKQSFALRGWCSPSSSARLVTWIGALLRACAIMDARMSAQAQVGGGGPAIWGPRLRGVGNGGPKQRAARSICRKSAQRPAELCRACSGPLRSVSDIPPLSCKHLCPVISRAGACFGRSWMTLGHNDPT